MTTSSFKNENDNAMDERHKAGQACYLPPKNQPELDLVIKKHITDNVNPKSIELSPLKTNIKVHKSVNIANITI